MTLVACRAIGGAHHAAGEAAAGAVVVAHLDRALQAAGSPRVVGPVERGRHVLGGVAGRIAEQRAVVEARRAHDAAGIERAAGVEGVLHLLEGRDQPPAIHRLVELAAHQTVAVLAGVRALVFAHQGEGFLSDRAHRAHVALEPQVQHRADMQAAFGGVRVPRTARAVLLEHLGEPVGVVGEMRERHGAVLDEGDRLRRALHRHHDVEPGGAQRGDRRLRAGVQHLDHAAILRAGTVEAVAEIAHHLDEATQTPAVLGVALGELDQQQRRRRAAHHGSERRAEHVDLAGELEHRGIDEFDRDRAQRHQVLRRLHGAAEAPEMAHAEAARAEQRGKFQLDDGGVGEGALGPHQHMREIGSPARGVERVEVVAADAPLHAGEFLPHLVRLARADREQALREVARAGVVELREAGIDLAEMHARAVGEHGVDRGHVVAHGAVTQRAAATGIVAGHAADGGAGRGGDVDREPEPVRLELAVQLVEHDARLDHAAARLDVEVPQAGEVLRAVDHQPIVDGLAALRGAAAARGDGNAALGGQGECAQRVLGGARHDHAGRHHLVVRGVGGVAAARGEVEQHVARNLGTEPGLEVGARPRASRRVLDYVHGSAGGDCAYNRAAGAAVSRLFRRCRNSTSLNSPPARRRSASRMASCSRIASLQRSRSRLAP